MIKQYFAHTLPDKPPTEWQPLEQHLKETAEKTKEFASTFGAVYQLVKKYIKPSLQTM